MEQCTLKYGMTTSGTFVCLSHSIVDQIQRLLARMFLCLHSAKTHLRSHIRVTTVMIL
jgi:hypothetical protein